MSNYFVVEFEVYPAMDKDMDSVKLSPLTAIRDKLSADYLFLSKSDIIDVRTHFKLGGGSSNVSWYSVFFAKRGDIRFVDDVREEVAKSFPEPIGVIPISSFSKYVDFREMAEFELREEFETHLKVQGEWGEDTEQEDE